MPQTLRLNPATQRVCEQTHTAAIMSQYCEAAGSKLSLFVRVELETLCALDLALALALGALGSPPQA